MTDKRGITFSIYPIRKRLWQIGVGLALFITTAIVMNAFQPADKAVTRKSAGHDFLAFYTAGTFVRTGRADQLYDLPAVRSFQRDLVQREGLELREDAFGPFWNPPLLAWVFVPLSRLSYHTAWNVWLAINLACFAGAMVILSWLIGGTDIPVCAEEHRQECLCHQTKADWRTWGLIPLLAAVSMPFIQALGHGQNTCISLLLLSATAALWRNSRAIAAGIVAGLLFYKPQLAAVVAGALILTLGWRAIIGLAISGSAMLLATLVTLPGTIDAFLHRLPLNIHYMQIERRYLWERHVTLKAFWRLLLQGYELGDVAPLTRALYVITTLAIAAALFAVIWKFRRDIAVRDRLMATTILAMPLLMPFYFDYDLLLMSVAATFVARDVLARGEPLRPRLLAGWAILFAATIFNPAIAGATHVNCTVLALCGLSGMMMHEMLSKQTRVIPMTPPQADPLRAAA